nr:hypothetical protein [Pseudodesulfovibrio cashew]
MPSRFSAILWWAVYTVLGVWAQRFVPGVDFLAPGIVLSMQRNGPSGTFWLALSWVLLQEGMGNLPFGYGVAWYGMLVIFYIMGRWLFEARSFLFMCLLGLGLGLLHPVLAYSLARLANLAVDLRVAALEGAVQAAIFPMVWVLAETAFPRRVRQHVGSL